ncbi:MAG: hypothetical protein R3E08_06830 [Thiotrichaceae bacterium]
MYLALPALYGIAMTAGTVVEVVIAVIILRYYHFRDDFSQARDVILFAVVTRLLAPCLSKH